MPVKISIGINTFNLYVPADFRECSVSVSDAEEDVKDCDFPGVTPPSGRGHTGLISLRGAIVAIQ